MKMRRIVEKCPRNEVVFDKRFMGSSFATEFGLVCEDFPLRGVFNAFIMGGMLIGSFTIGMISDAVGRKKALALCVVLYWTAGTINAFSQWRVMFGVCQIIVGMSSVGQFMCAFVLLAEATLPSSTNVITKSIDPTFPLGGLVLGLMAYAMRERFELQLVLFAPMILTVVPLYFVKESPRWLIAHGRYTEAKDVIRYMAKLNGKPYPDNLTATLTDNSASTNAAHGCSKGCVN